VGDRDAIDLALGALRFRDLSAAELDARLDARGIECAERHEVLETLARAGYVSDERLAHTRAAALAERGCGDALIRVDLEGRGIASELVGRALETLEAERVRAERVAARRGWSPATIRYLAARGFSEEALETFVARDADGAIG